MNEADTYQSGQNIKVTMKTAWKKKKKLVDSRIFEMVDREIELQ